MTDMLTNEKTRQRIITVLSEVLDRLCDRNNRYLADNEDRHESLVTRFHALRPPTIDIKYYLQRISKYSNCSEECFVLALIFIDRLIRANEKFLVTSLNVHRLIITAVMIAAKFFDDQYFNNAYYGKVGGVACREMNLLEIEFLFMLNFNLFVELSEYEVYSERLLNHRGGASTVATEPTRAVEGPTTVSGGSKTEDNKVDAKTEIGGSGMATQQTTAGGSTTAGAGFSAAYPTSFATPAGGPGGEHAVSSGPWQGSRPMASGKKVAVVKTMEAVPRSKPRATRSSKWGKRYPRQKLPQGSVGSCRSAGSWESVAGSWDNEMNGDRGGAVDNQLPSMPLSVSPASDAASLNRLPICT